jgi:hypothetical protein
MSLSAVALQRLAVVLPLGVQAKQPMRKVAQVQL